MTSLQPVPNATREHVTALEQQVLTQERRLTALKTELQKLQTKYLAEIGPLYDELIPLDEAVAEAEIAAGLRAPEEEPGPEEKEPGPEACAPASEPSVDLKRMFRDIARNIHPDRSHHEVDERTRFRRHSLMAEANRAYAERDEDRLRLILRAWELDPESVADDNAPDEDTRLRRRASILAARLVEIEAAFADLQASAIARLKIKIDDARAQGWDLFAEMKRQVQREIAMGKATLAKLQRRRRTRLSNPSLT